MAGRTAETATARGRSHLRRHADAAHPEAPLRQLLPGRRDRARWRVDRALVAAVAEMYATGTSTRKVQRVAEKIGVSRLSKDQVSAIASSLDQASRICTEGRSRARQCPTSGSTRPTSRSPLFFEIVFRKIAKAISF